MTEPNTDPTLCRAFVAEARKALAQWPNVAHTWSIDADEDHCILDIPSQSESGFAIGIEVYPNEIIVETNGPHFHHDLVGDPSEFVRSIVGLLRDLLSSSMRIREVRAGERAYKWHLESFKSGVWVVEDTVGLLLAYRPFRKRSERIYQNLLLPPRTL